MFEKIKRTPKGMISTEGLSIGITGDIEVLIDSFGFPCEKFLKQHIVLVGKIKNKKTNDILYKDVFNETIYTYRLLGEPNNINYILPLPFTQKYITTEEAKELYLKAKEMFYSNKKSPEQNKEEEKSKNIENKPKKSKLRCRSRR